MNAVDSPSVTLDNCDREPIHTPGHVQSHGALLAFSQDGTLTHLSATAGQILRCDLPALGDFVSSRHFDGHAAVREALDAVWLPPAGEGPLARQHEITLGGEKFDLIAHRFDATAVVEFERQALDASGLAPFAMLARQGVDKLRRQAVVQNLLEVAVAEIRQMTGFDRVMAYRFRADGSGEVVAEERADGLEAFLNQRYPAGDIPVQARRLYVVNTLRLIADVRSLPVAVMSREPQLLDMSHCVLRSVSPVHIEYLGNMGVGASMSISIVINEELWGMVACHHMSPRLVNYPVRMACDVLSQIFAARLQSVLVMAHSQRAREASTLRASLVEKMHSKDEMAQPLAAMAGDLMATFDAAAAIVVDDLHLSVHGDISLDSGRALVDWLNLQQQDADRPLIQCSALAELPPALGSAMGTCCGFLAMRFDLFSDGWLVVLRPEQVETVAWAGKPEKNTVVGALGERLTPRGSFDVWLETVRGVAVPWNPAELQIAREMLDDLTRACAWRHAQLSRSKDMMMAVLGHDLRTPLQSISMAGHLIGQTTTRNAQMSESIKRSSNRMERLIAQTLEMSRIQNGLALAFAPALVDLSAFLEQVLDENALAHPETLFTRAIAPGLMASVDTDRTAQLLTNLLGNAHHHGTQGADVEVTLAANGPQILLEVRNPSAPIPDPLRDQLFEPFKRRMPENQRNLDGLGIGLYIAQQIARGQGGTLGYRFDTERGQVVFGATFVAA